jgi:hypothetical protein
MGNDLRVQAKVIYDELFKHPTLEFKKHLNAENNSRILFSGMYGVGKSTFMQHFFAHETQSKTFGEEKYRVIQLNPVNYSVSTNEDIFKFIKIDVLKELLTKHQYHIDFNHDKLSFSTVAAFYIAEKFNNIAGPLLMLMGQLNITNFPNEEILSACGTIKKLSDEVTSGIDKRVNESDNLKNIRNFVTPEFEREGSLYEQNLITNLIIDFTNQLRESDKETILIIDDLDRLDPSHIFRLFNVFAAHFDQESETQNKFGFDKVIFVCDVDNIRRLYRHFYGGSNSFNGYIDKFYSHKIFYYDNKSSVKAMVSSIVDRLNIYYDSVDERKYISNNSIRANLSVVLSSFLENGNINLRSLLKLSNPVVIKRREITTDLRWKTNIDNPVTIELEVLVQLLNHKDEVKEALSNSLMKGNFLHESNMQDYAYSNLVHSCVPLISRKFSTETVLQKYAIDDNRAFYVNTGPRPGDYDVRVKNLGNFNEPATESHCTPAVELYIKAFEHLDKINYL